ncbi:MAG: SDR family oxidoreductase [Legionellales bacterium]|nr:SDR family oxidoreductase [Legionellales bacterium]
MSLLSGKKALIVGLASQRSIAYGIASAFHQQGAELAFTYQTEKLRSRVEKAAEEFNAQIILPLDVTQDDQINQVFTSLQQHWGSVDIIIHSVAFAPGELLEGDYLENMNREGFNLAHDISSYSFAALAKAAQPMLNRNGALLTLTYLGAEKIVSNYNVMGVAKASLEANMRYIANSLGPQGVRVNAISAGPIRTLAASGIKGFKQILGYHEQVTPLRQNTTIEQVGNTAAFLCSELADGITAEVIHVDGGFHAMSIGQL